MYLCHQFNMAMLHTALYREQSTIKPDPLQKTRYTLEECFRSNRLIIWVLGSKSTPQPTVWRFGDSYKQTMGNTYDFARNNIGMLHYNKVDFHVEYYNLWETSIMLEVFKILLFRLELGFVQHATMVFSTMISFYV